MVVDPEIYKVWRSQERPHTADVYNIFLHFLSTSFDNVTMHKCTFSKHFLTRQLRKMILDVHNSRLLNSNRSDKWTV